MEYRIEKDTMGEVKVPLHAYYGAQTQRSIDNFKIAEDINKMPKEIIKAFAYLKKAAALANFDAGVLPKEKADLIVMGITGSNTTEEALIGSNTLHLAKHIELPVIIVPPFVKYSPIKNILLLSDYRDVYETTPIDLITAVLDTTKATLHVSYVQQTKKELVGAEVAESITLNTLFQGYDPQYHYTQNDNFIDGVNDFVETNAIDLLLIIPKHHTIIDKIFHRSKTKMMVFHSYIPVLLVHDKR